MDTGFGKFEPISKAVAETFSEIPDLRKSRIFCEGETVEVKGSKFRIDKIKQRTLRLLLLPDDK